MEVTKLDVELLGKMFLMGAKSLESQKDWINDLNVFPVPDGDTGTNMTMTIMSAVEAVLSLENPDLNSLCKAIRSGSLRGARGNSGVILSQLLRGFTKGLDDCEAITVDILSDAFQRSVETAYKAVMKPKEGTILTVARAAADKALEMSSLTTDVVVFAEEVIKEAEKTLAKTPEMLPVLKEAGVVDSGGQGLVVVLKGAQAALLGEELNLDEFGPVSKRVSANVEVEDVDIKFGYCTEFIINLDNPLPIEEVNAFKEFLESIGDSIVVVADDDLVKTHVHTNDPGKALSKALEIGASLSKIKIDNMREEHHERLIKDASKKAKEEELKKNAPAAPTKDVGFISVATGEGICQLFKDYGVDAMIEGGQTMNPSTDDILKAVDKTPAKNIFILPNNKNIILAAEQAAKISKDKNLIVIPTKTIPQGITSLLTYMADLSVEDNIDAMKEAIAAVKTGQLTYAVRDTSIDGREIKINDFMGMGDSGLLSVSSDINESFIEMVEAMIDDDSSIVTVYYGEGVTAEDAQALCDKVLASHPELEAVDMVDGGQAVYSYIVSVE